MKELQNCWIRGHMDEKKYKDDSVRLATIRCPYRKGQVRTFFFGAKRLMDYDCTHPAMQNKDYKIVREEGGKIVAGHDTAGLLATFCIPVDMHRRSLGERSKLIIEGEYTVVKDEKHLPPPQK